MRRKATLVVLLGLAISAIATACGGSSGGGDSDSGPIVIGASLPMSGAVGAYGPLLKQGYQYAIDQVNSHGGLDIGGTKRKVQLVVLDNKSDGTIAGRQARSLVLEKGAVGLLGGLDNVQNIPIASVAEQQKVPMVTTYAPKRDWIAGNKDGWNYAWLLFFDEEQASTLPFATADMTDTNKKIALFINGGTGRTFHGLFLKNADAAGYTVVADDVYPLGNTNFSDAIAKAKSADAEVVVALGTPPEGFALWKQMKALNYVPKVAFCDLCANTGAWNKVLGPLSNGTSAFGWWSPSLKYPGTEEIVAKFEPVVGDNEDLTGIVGASTVAQVLLEGIASAGSTDGTKVNGAIAKTDKTYTFGPVKFDADGVSVVKAVEKQWQGDAEKIVHPDDVAQAKLQVPVAGLE
jgi:branched-chain amino acid transport system substrate-binding protein